MATTAGLVAQLADVDLQHGADGFVVNQKPCSFAEKRLAADAWT